MQPGKEISDELKGLGSYLADLNRSVPFAIPEGYFNNNIAVKKLTPSFYLNCLNSFFTLDI